MTDRTVQDYFVERKKNKWANCGCAAGRVCVHVYTLIWPAKKKKKNLPGVVVVPLYSRWPSVGNFISFPADDDAQRLGSRYT
jgi:hypothetical protein